MSKHALSTIVLLVMIALAFGSVDSESTANHQPGKIDAWVMAQKFVTQQLKSPSTASFGGGGFSSDYQDPEDVVEYLGHDRFRVLGWVDAENSFGATVRNDFVCELEYIGDDKWRCIDLQLLPR